MANRKNNLNDHHNKLSILTAQGGFSFLVHSSKDTKLISHHEHKTASPEDQLTNIKKVINDDFIVEHHIDEALLIFDNALFTLVPDIYFDTEKVAHFLKYNAELLPGDLIDHDEVPNLGAKVVHIPMMNIHEYFIEMVGNVRYKHQMSTLLNAFDPGKENKETIFLNRYFDNCHIIAYYKAKCHLANRFRIQTDEDLAYYLLTVIDQLKFDREELRLVISGFVDIANKAYEYLYDHIRNIDFFKPELTAEHFLCNAITHKEINLVCHYLSE
jgi:hypothetical protein